MFHSSQAPKCTQRVWTAAISRSFKRLITAVSAATILATTAHAVELKPLSSLKWDAPDSTPADAVQGTVVLRNDAGRSITLTSKPFRSDGAYFELESVSSPVRAGESIALRYRGQIKRAGKWGVEIPIEAFDAERRVSLGQIFAEIYFSVTPDRSGALFARRSNYEELFLKSGAQNIPGQGRVFQSTADDGSIPKGPDYRNNKQPPMKSWPLKPDRELSRRIPNGTGVGSGRLHPEDRDEPFGRLIERWFESLPEDLIGPDDHAWTPEWSDTQDNRDEYGIYGSVTASGMWSYKGIDNVLHPGWGWRVRAWVKAGASWSIAAEDWVEWDGRWTLAFNQPSGAQVQFQYVAYNRYFTPQSNDGDTYRWVGPVRGALASNHAEGSWFADTSGGNVRGLGELYKDAYTLWSNLYWQGNINPLRNASIKVIFPNLSYKCGGDSVWSCANTSGTIWLIPSHGTNGQTIIHELGHQLNYEYWNNSLPAGTGGSHSMSNCYTAGLALTEGFANFIVGWTKTNRDNNVNMVRNLEDPSVIGACTTTNLNEGYVGAAFWDLHDKVADGKDTIWFVHRGAVPALFLNAGMKQKMSDFLQTYRNAANAEHREIIDAIFDQNHVK